MTPPRVRQFVNDLELAGAAVRAWPPENLTMPLLLEQMVEFVADWNIGPFNDLDDDGTWELELYPRPLTPVEAFELAWRVDHVLAGVIDWYVRSEGEAVFIRVLGEPQTNA